MKQDQAGAGQQPQQLTEWTFKPISSDKTLRVEIVTSVFRFGDKPISSAHGHKTKTTISVFGFGTAKLKDKQNSGMTTDKEKSHQMIKRQAKRRICQGKPTQ